MLEIWSFIPPNRNYMCYHQHLPSFPPAASGSYPFAFSMSRHFSDPILKWVCASFFCVCFTYYNVLQHYPCYNKWNNFLLLKESVIVSYICHFFFTSSSDNGHWVLCHIFAIESNVYIIMRMEMCTDLPTSYPSAIVTVAIFLHNLQTILPNSCLISILPKTVQMYMFLTFSPHKSLSLS
jgi:hypothetical protein